MVILRFAPSPTGALHLGGLRTALFNHIYARKKGGKWILRIEDTDAARAVPGAVDGIRSALAWAGLEYDYGPGIGGPHGPYYQSQRLDLYQKYSKKLLESGHAYRCFCSADRLASTREKLARSGSNFTYDKACLHLTEEEAARRVRAGEKYIVRLNDHRLPIRPTPADLVFGALKDAHASLPTDPVLLKTDLFPTYHLASIVDDYEMGVTHVLRGEEWLPSLPLHLDLYACLNLRPPQFAHVPILLNSDGSKMSKRKGDVQVQDFVDRDWEPDAVLNWLALSGWGVQHQYTDISSQPTSNHNVTEEGSSASFPAHQNAPNSTAVMTLPELIENFDLSALTHRRSILDPVKLEYLNKHHLMRIWSDPQGLTSLAERVQNCIKEAFPSSPYTTIEDLKKVILVLQGRLTNLQDVKHLAPYFFVEPDLSSPEAMSMMKSISPEEYTRTLGNVYARLEQITGPWRLSDLSTSLHDENAKLGISQKNFMTVLRRALSGMKTGPSVPEIMMTLGQERTMLRLLKLS